MASGSVSPAKRSVGAEMSPSAIKGEDGSGLRELRPRAGRSRWRGIYRRVEPGTFVILAVAPEAEIDRRGFDEKVRDARRRFDELEK